MDEMRGSISIDSWVHYNIGLAIKHQMDMESAYISNLSVYTNTNPGHNKIYTLYVLRFADPNKGYVLRGIYGPIGKTHTMVEKYKGAYPSSMDREVGKVISEKLKKGYVEREDLRKVILRSVEVLPSMISVTEMEAVELVENILGG